MIIGRHKFALLTEATRTLTGTALGPCPTTASFGRCICRYIVAAHLSWITTFILAFFVVESTVTLFADFDQFVATESALRRRETIAFLAVFDGVQHIGNVTNGTCGKFTVIRTITASGTGEHNVIATDPARPALLRIVMLFEKKKTIYK